MIKNLILSAAVGYHFNQIEFFIKSLRKYYFGDVGFIIGQNDDELETIRFYKKTEKNMTTLDDKFVYGFGYTAESGIDFDKLAKISNDIGIITLGQLRILKSAAPYTFKIAQYPDGGLFDFPLIGVETAPGVPSPTNKLTQYPESFDLNNIVV